MTSLGMQTSENCYLSRLARAGPRNCLFLPLEAKSGIYEWPHCHITWNSNINLKFRPFFQKKAFYITHEHKDLYSKAEVFCWPFQINEKKFWFSNSVMHSISATEPWAGAKKKELKSDLLLSSPKRQRIALQTWFPDTKFHKVFWFFAEEEMSCLATWKEGSRRYMVSMMNHSHVHNDDSRYRCFIYQKLRHGGGGSSGKEVTYKMAQSSWASCLGLWNVDEGYKTFTLKKRE